MADIFISYAQDEGELTKALAADLEKNGYSTWWDINLLPGDDFWGSIEHEIDAADAVIVIWTESAVKSENVKAEANRAKTRQKLITVRAPNLRAEKIPLPFNTRQAALVTDRRKIYDSLSKLGCKPHKKLAELEAISSELAKQMTALARFYLSNDETRARTLCEKAVALGNIEAETMMELFFTC